VIYRIKAPALEPENSKGMESAWRALRRLTDDLLGSLGNNQPDLKKKLERYGEGLGQDFASLDLLAFGIFGGALKKYNDLAVDELMPGVAADLLEILANHELFLAHFKEWEEFRGAIATAFADEKAEIQGVEDARKAEKAIIEEAPTLIDIGARNPLSMLGDTASEEKSAESRRAYLRSIRGLLLRIAGDVIKPVGEGMREGIKDRAKALTVTAIDSAAIYLSALASGIPLEFSWLGAVILYIRNTSGKAKK
jgi:hypothetical protein